MVMHGMHARMSHWEVASKKKKDRFEKFYYLAKFYVAPAAAAEPTVDVDGMLADAEELGFGGSAGDVFGDDGEGKPKGKDYHRWKGWTAGGDEGSVTVQFKYIPPPSPVSFGLGCTHIWCPHLHT